MKQFLIQLVLGINVVAMVYVLLVDVVYVIQLVVSTLSLTKYIKIRHCSDHERYYHSQNAVPISLLVPAYNEATTIIENVSNLLQLDYPEYEVIVVNDGSKDGTLQLLVEHFAMVKISQPIKCSIATQEVLGVYRCPQYPNLVVLDKLNGGKADALNAGINASRYPVFISIDADSLLEKDSLMKVVMPFMKDHRVVSVGGIVRILDGCDVDSGDLKRVGLSKNPIVTLQTVEYLRAFLAGRLGFDALGILLIVSGAFGAFNKKVVIDAGGYNVDTIGEDMELVVRLHKFMRDQKKEYIIQFIADPVCWTQPPTSFSDLRKQRRRWQIGTISTLLKHRDMLLNPKYGRIGMVAMVYYWLFEVVGPVLEALGFLLVPLAFLLGIVNINFFIAFYVASMLFGMVLSVGALLLEEHTFKKYPTMRQLLKLMLFALLDNFGYRQLNTLFRLDGLLGYRKNKRSWGSLNRKSFGAQGAAK